MDDLYIPDLIKELLLLIITRRRL